MREPARRDEGNIRGTHGVGSALKPEPGLGGENLAGPFPFSVSTQTKIDTARRAPMTGAGWCHFDKLPPHQLKPLPSG